MTPAFDDKRSLTEPCAICHRLVQGSDRQPRYLSPPVASVAHLLPLTAAAARATRFGDVRMSATERQAMVERIREEWRDIATNALVDARVAKPDIDLLLAAYDAQTTQLFDIAADRDLLRQQADAHAKELDALREALDKARSPLNKPVYTSRTSL